MVLQIFVRKDFEFPWACSLLDPGQGAS